MDTATLVDEKIEHGRLLVEQLQERGFDVSVAFWALTSEEGLWFLYIASTVVDQEGLAAAYGQVYGELSSSGIQSVSRSDIKLIGQHNPIATDAMTYRNRQAPTRYAGRTLGNVIVDEAYIYPG